MKHKNWQEPLMNANLKEEIRVHTENTQKLKNEVSGRMQEIKNGVDGHVQIIGQLKQDQVSAHNAAMSSIELLSYLRQQVKELLNEISEVKAGIVDKNADIEAEKQRNYKFEKELGELTQKKKKYKSNMKYLEKRLLDMKERALENGNNEKNKNIDTVNEIARLNSHINEIQENIVQLDTDKTNLEGLLQKRNDEYELKSTMVLSLNAKLKALNKIGLKHKESSIEDKNKCKFYRTNWITRPIILKN